MPWSFATRIITQWFLPFQRILMYILTGKSQFERIIANRTLPFPFRVHQIEKSIDFTSSKSLDNEIEQTKIDKNKSVIHDQLYVVIHKLELYQKLIKQINEIKTTKVTSTDEEHLELFEKVWSRLVTQSNDDHEPLNMISKRWTKIGFQV
jgi:hypothetical protein